MGAACFSKILTLTYILIYPSVHSSTHLRAIDTPTHIHIYLLLYLLLHLHIYLLTYLFTYLHTHPSTHQSNHQSTHRRTHPSLHSPNYIPTIPANCILQENKKNHHPSFLVYYKLLHNNSSNSYNKSQRNALFLKFILVKNSICFGQIYCPSSGVSTLYTQQ